MLTVFRCLVVCMTLVASGVVRAQSVTWEKLPILFDYGPNAPKLDSAEFIGFVAGGDTLFAAGNDGHYLFHAEADGGTGVWEQLCPSNCTTEDGLVTRAGTLIVASSLTGVGCDRSLNHGRTWQQNVAPQQRDCHAIHQSALPAYGGPDGGRIIGAQVSAPCFSDEDGAPGTWTCGPSSGGGTGGDTVAFGDVMPSAALPEGRLLAGVWNGITTSDDGGRTWQPSSLYGFARAITRSLTWVPEVGHPYGGAALAAVQDFGLGERDSLATIWRSDDGGSTWTSVHRFSPTEYGIPDQGDNGEGYPLGYRLNQAVLFTASDGVVWAGLYANVAGPAPANGSMARSFDGGRTWEVAAGPGSGWGGARGASDHGGARRSDLRGGGGGRGVADSGPGGGRVEHTGSAGARPPRCARGAESGRRARGGAVVADRGRHGAGDRPRHARSGGAHRHRPPPRCGRSEH
ncbi:MAG: sialidase family protein, partial [Bacteroidota bacterium]